MTDRASPLLSGVPSSGGDTFTPTAGTRYTSEHEFYLHTRHSTLGQPPNGQLLREVLPSAGSPGDPGLRRAGRGWLSKDALGQRRLSGACSPRCHIR